MLSMPIFQPLGKGGDDQDKKRIQGSLVCVMTGLPE
jgi:hypothetical protein